jgi:hypothetical protein
MSVLFKRVGRVELSSDGGVTTVEGLRFDFSVRKTRSGTPNAVTCRIYNTSPDTQNIARDIEADIRIFAGFEGNAALVTEANITNAVTIRQPPETFLEIDAQEGIRALRETQLSLTHGTGSTVQQVLDEIVADLDIVLRPIEFDLSIPLRGGFAYVGKPSKALDDLVRRFRGSWSIQNGELMILDESGEQPEEDEIPLLTPQTGLLFSPEKLQRNLSSEKQSSDERDGYRVISLMQPSIEPGSKVQIESRDVSGEFVVDEVEHKGDIHGNEWYTELTVLEGGE